MLKLLFTWNSALRFLLELTSLVILIRSGFHKSLPTGLLIGLLLPLLLAVLWAFLIAPAAAHRLPQFSRFLLEILIFASVAYVIFRDAGGKIAVCYFIFCLFNSIGNLLGDNRQ